VAGAALAALTRSRKVETGAEDGTPVGPKP
jgi:hypothetical protein